MTFKRLTFSLCEMSDTQVNRLALLTGYKRSQVVRAAIQHFSKMDVMAVRKIISEELRDYEESADT